MSFFDVLGDCLSAVINTAEDAVSYVKENPLKCATIAVTAVASGGVAAACAPAIGAAISSAGFGVAGGTLSGAAAQSAGLAWLGGGSIASGGFGMAGGTAVITATGATTGAGCVTLAAG